MIKAFKKQFIPYGKQKITNDDIEAVTNTLKSEYLTQGPVGEIFEAKISKSLSHCLISSKLSLYDVILILFDP